MKIEKFLYLKQQSFRPNNRTNRARTIIVAASDHVLIDEFLRLDEDTNT